MQNTASYTNLKKPSMKALQLVSATVKEIAKKISEKKNYYET